MEWDGLKGGDMGGVRKGTGKGRSDIIVIYFKFCS